MNTKPLSNYIKGVAALKAGHKTEAEDYLAASMGITKATPIMRDSLHQLLNEDNPNIAITTLLIKRLSED
jgi:hypothetical protein